MRQSQLFSKTKREAPKDEQAKNAQLLIQAGFVHKEMAGVYTYLPLGLRVLNNIENIIREEMDAIGGQEMLLTTLQDPKLWEKSGRWSDDVVDNWFKTKLAAGGELGVANTHEEPLTELLKHHVNSYKDLPVYAYQFQTKFRNELRAKSGLMRGREFLMKDLYSFTKTEEDFREFYEACAKAYQIIFDRLGIGNITYRTLAAGGSFTTGYTDEFQTITDAGEDTIYVSEDKNIAINEEVLDEKGLETIGVTKEELVEKKAVEVGNIFPLHTKYSEALGLTYKDEEGKEQPIVMGSYGIGLGRLMGTIAEVLSDEKGLVWPESIAPFSAHIIVLSNSEEAQAQLDGLVQIFEKAGQEVLIDDRDASAGQKFADSDLIGIPTRIVVSDKTVEKGMVEKRIRRTEDEEYVSLEDIEKKVLQTE